ncbi:MAG: hypothetical protein AMXMBFR66_01910 [Pseudomonadota bacterium]|nr:PaaI family thioesterase [Rubrivivax sp.]NLZ41922.1 PaaI family thioesterase [Comamonadaceae bacterium]
MPGRQAFPRRIPFADTLGFELWRFDGGHAELLLALEPALHNSFGVAHGGVLMTLLDVAMAHAARSVHARTPQADHGVVTIEMKTSFVQPAEGRLRCDARLLHRTATLAFCEGSVSDAAARLCAHATGTFKYLRALPAGRELRSPRHAGRDEPPPSPAAAAAQAADSGAR